MHAAGLSNGYPGWCGSVSGGVSGLNKASVGFTKEIVSALCVVLRRTTEYAKRK